MNTKSSRILQSFDNPKTERDYLISIELPEFTCLCPVTGQPDFATMTLTYIPDRECIELKSLKLYIWSFREQGCYHEEVTNNILDDLVSVVAPRFVRLTAEFNVRGGTYPTIIAEHKKTAWSPTDSTLIPKIEVNR
jgi:7-cyano-7-deazaguanine reductase